MTRREGYVEEFLEVTPGVPDFLRIPRCVTCGALVGDMNEHDDWHERMAAQVDRMEPSGPSGS